MQQDFTFNQKSLDDILKFTMKQNEKGKKGISGKIDQIYNSTNNLKQYKITNEESIKYLVNNLNMISKNLLDIFQKERKEDGSYQETQYQTNKLDEVNGFQLCSDQNIGTERQPEVTKHNDILVEMNSEAQQFLQKKINLPLNDKTGQDFQNLFYRTTRIQNCGIDNLLNGIKEQHDLKTIVTNRIRIEEDLKMQQYQQNQNYEQEQEQDKDQYMNYIEQEDINNDDMNQNQEMQNDYDQEVQQNDDQFLQNDDDMDEHI